jgi:oligoribonuclease (3'-5' exoribonuclease)
MRPYVSIDIETTGLNPNTCQVLEIGAVIHDPAKPLLECPTFRACIKHDVIAGTPSALQMNARLLEEIADGGGKEEDYVVEWFHDWLKDHLPIGELTENCVHALGKNVGTFDLVFLDKIGNWPTWLFHYRSLDVGSMYALPEGIPAQGELECKLADEFLIPGKPHEALYDAFVSLALARKFWEGSNVR